MNSRHVWIVVTVLLGWLLTVAVADDARVHVNEGSDPRAIEIAQATAAAMGGWEALDATRYVSWNFFGRRLHYWDRHAGRARIEAENEGVRTVFLLDVATREGSVWRDGERLEGEQAAEALATGHQIWINDTYWVFMPWKLLDPGVTLGYLGEKPTAEGNDARVLDLTFGEGVGYTPQNRYHVYVGKASGLVEQWDFFAEADAEEPNFAMPWAKWAEIGGLLFATDHGRGADWDIRVHDDLPDAVFEDPAPIER